MDFEAAKSFILKRLQNELPEYLTYHTLHHVIDVYNAAEMLADMEGVKGVDKLLLLTAVLCHDAGFLVSQKEHEKLSCDFSRQHLPGFNYNEEQVEKICEMILATRIPQTPNNLSEEIICDADLDYLGRDDFYTIGRGLYKEFEYFDIVHNEEDWNNLQIRFLENHHYFTKTAIRLRKARKDQYVNELKAIVT